MRAGLSMRLAVLAILLAVLWLAWSASGSRAFAHDFRPGVLALDERAPGEYAMSFVQPVDTQQPERAPVRVRFPNACQTRDATTLVCAPDAPLREIRFEGLEGRARIIVSIRDLDGERREGVARAGASSIDLPNSAGSTGFGSTFVEWVRIGVEHVLSGFDHVLFLIGLLLIVGGTRRLVWTITSFTLAHCITLVLATLDVVRLPAAPVEACIALSVLLVAREALPDRADAATLTRRAPWIVALLFGLVHGLGFAGALRSLRLPDDAIAGALLGFNAGVELGQLALVAVALALAALARVVLAERPRWSSSLRALVSYGIGATAACWLIERCLAIVVS